MKYILALYVILFCFSTGCSNSNSSNNNPNQVIDDCQEKMIQYIKKECKDEFKLKQAQAQTEDMVKGLRILVDIGRANGMSDSEISRELRKCFNEAFKELEKQTKILKTLSEQR